MGRWTINPVLESMMTCSSCLSSEREMRDGLGENRVDDETLGKLVRQTAESMNESNMDWCDGHDEAYDVARRYRDEQNDGRISCCGLWDHIFDSVTYHNTIPQWTRFVDMHGRVPVVANDPPIVVTDYSELCGMCMERIADLCQDCKGAYYPVYPVYDDDK